MDSAGTVDGRRSERRTQARFVWRERRSGFDRRRHGPVVKRLLELRDSPIALLSLLAAVNVLNLLDQLATTRALAAGFGEANPVMAGLISFDPRLAAIVKITAIAGVSGGVWALRRYKVILEVGVLMLLVFTAVLLIHFAGSAFFY